MRNKLKLMFIFIGLSIVILVGMSVSAQSIGDRNRPVGTGGYRITGKVYLPDGMPAVNVTVTANSAEMSNVTSRTNQDGAFEISGLGAGNYNVSVREPGYKPESESITIAGGARGQTYPVVFRLTPPSETKAESPLLAKVPKDAVSKFQKGMEKASSDPKGAIGLFDEAINIYPNFAFAYYQKGSAYLKLNDADKAIESFVKAILIKPDYLEAKYGYGLAELQKKNYEVAAAVFGDVIQARKDMAEAHMNLGISLFYLKNITASEAALKTAVVVKGGENLALVHLYLGQIYMQTKKNADAVSELQKYLDLVPKAPNADRIKTAIAELKKQS